MSRNTFALASCLILAVASPASAAVLSLRFVTADGTWDCKDATGARVGALVVADTTYAFLSTEGKVAGYGTIRLVDGDFHLPKYTVMSGHLKDEKKVFGLTMRGPKEDVENFNGEIYLHAILGFDGKQDWDCERRGGRANQPPA
jgi:hypothetical protein